MENSIQVKTDPAEVQLLIRKLDSLQTVFTDPNLLIHHLKIIRMNPNYEWFNAALIACDERLKKSGFTMVRQLENWPENVQPFGIKGSGVRLLWPEYDSRKNILIWTAKTAFSILDFGLNETQHEKDVDTPLTLAIKTYDLDSIIDRQKGEWQEELMDLYLSRIPEYIRSEKSVQRFLKAALVMTYGSTLSMDVRLSKADLVLEQHKQSFFREYRDLYIVITEFVPFLISWMMAQTADFSGDVRSLTLQKLYGG